MILDANYLTKASLYYKDAFLFSWNFITDTYNVGMKKINETFVCLECGKSVPTAEKTCRNHCPFCFASQHVDGDIPGDRKGIVC